MNEAIRHRRVYAEHTSVACIASHHGRLSGNRLLHSSFLCGQTFHFA